jgi:hypothetical protein
MIGTAVSTEAQAEIANKVLTARTPQDVEALIDLAAKHGITDNRQVGDREANAGTIELASNPYSAIAERVTNGLDAVIEMRARLKGYYKAEDWPRLPQDPRDAAKTLFDLPSGGVADLTTKERRELAENFVVMLDDSGDKDAPTIINEDHGLGQSPDEFPEGLLSLNRSNKLRKPWLHGAYGQGGSATLRFSRYTIFISRKHPDLLDADQSDSVGWTIAYRDEGDPYREALPVYRFIVGPHNEVPSFDPALLPDPDWHGTRVVHVGYRLDRYSQAFTQLTNGLWGMFHHIMFDPVIPFLIGGRRQVDLNAVKKGAVADDDMGDLVVGAGDPTRVVIGNRMRLDAGPKGGDSEIPWKGSEIRDLSKAYGEDLGRLKVNYWVVRRPADSHRTTDPTLAYITADSAATVTLNGQRHGAERRAWLKDKLSLPYLSRHLIVQIDIDELSPPAKRELFSSTREHMVEGRMQKLIYEEALAALTSDTELRKFESEMRDRALKKGASEVGQKVREKLAKFVDTFIKNQTKTVKADAPDDTGTGPSPKPSGKKAPPRDTNDEHLPNVPNSIEFERDSIKITQGKRTTVWVRVNAKNGYLRRHEDDLSVSFDPALGGKVTDVAKSELLAGRSMWTLQAESDAPLGNGKIEAVLITPNGPISAEAKIEVIAPTNTSERKKKDKEIPLKGPNIYWVKREEWDADFNEKTVGRVDIGRDNTDIRVNRHHPLIDRALRDKSLTKDQVATREDRYLFAIGCGLFRQEYAMKEAESRPSDPQIEAEQERMAEAVLIAIDDRMIDLED